MNSDRKERYIRWQEYRINQLSFSIDLFLGFSVASLAYSINFKIGNAFSNNIPILTIILIWGISAALGCLAVISKLLDYRYTARKIKDGGDFNAAMAKYTGPITWGLFWGQLISYAVGSAIFVIGVLYA